MGSVVNTGLHAYGDKWVAIVIVMAIHMCVGQDSGIGLRLAKEKQLTFNLGEMLAPKIHRHGGQASAEYADHVVLERLDGLLGDVAMMVIGGGEFVCHLGVQSWSCMQTMLGCQVFGAVGQCHVRPFARVHNDEQ